MSAPRAVLLDLDGTLVDSRAGIVAGMNQTLEALGEAPRPAAELHAYIGPPLHDTFAALLGRSADAPGIDAIVADYRKRYSAVMLELTPVFPGVPEALDALIEAGCVLAIATSKARPLAEKLAEGLGLAGRLEAICGPVPPARDDKTTTIAQALAALRVGRPGRFPSHAVMVGDRRHDVEGAHAHGLSCVGVLWGIGDRAELREAGAEVLCQRPQDLARVVLGLFG